MAEDAAGDLPENHGEGEAIVSDNLHDLKCDTSAASPDENEGGNTEAAVETPDNSTTETVIESLRHCIPVEATSEEGKYLEEKVWPTLEVSSRLYISLRIIIAACSWFRPIRPG